MLPCSLTVTARPVAAPWLATVRKNQPVGFRVSARPEAVSGSASVWPRRIRGQPEGAVARTAEPVWRGRTLMARRGLVITSTVEAPLVVPAGKPPACPIPSIPIVYAISTPASASATSPVRVNVQ